jgi:hypothetical protein
MDSILQQIRAIHHRADRLLEDDGKLILPALEVGDILLVGKFKNRRATIKGFDIDEHGQPVANTDKGDQKIFKPRIEKLIPHQD